MPSTLRKLSVKYGSKLNIRIINDRYIAHFAPESGGFCLDARVALPLVPSGAEYVEKALR